MKGLEGPVLEGEVVPCTALIRNAGNLPMNCLRLLVSESDLYCCSSKAFLGQNLNTLTGIVPAECLPPPHPIAFRQGFHAILSYVSKLGSMS